MDDGLTGLREELLAFVTERDWDQFHDPKDLALSLSIEASELLEVFQWRAPGEPIDDATRGRIAEELADVLLYALLLARKADVDLLTAAHAKLNINRMKYPIDKARGRSEKYDRL